MKRRPSREESVPLKSNVAAAPAPQTEYCIGDVVVGFRTAPRRPKCIYMYTLTACGFCIGFGSFGEFGPAGHVGFESGLDVLLFGEQFVDLSGVAGGEGEFFLDVGKPYFGGGDAFFQVRKFACFLKG